LKKYTPYILAGLVIVAIILLFLTGKDRKSTLDERLSYRKRDKIPYGTFVAFENLKHLFPEASVFTSRKEPGNWDSVSADDTNQALFILCPEFSADEYEMKNLIGFAQSGNDVFISAMDISPDAASLMHCNVSTIESLIAFFSQEKEADTLELSLVAPPFPSPETYMYPGRRLDSYFSSFDSTISTVLGRNSAGKPDFIHLRTGKGNLYLHLAPMAFSNYFLLHKNNFAYYEQVLSLISPGITKIVWDEYYLYKKGSGDRGRKNRNWLSVLLNIKNADGKPSFAAAFWVLLSLLVLFVLMEMRRKQRYIPIVKKLQNDSLDFVKTIGRLYYDKGDHRNLCRKMSAYFLEHVRNRYKLPTSRLNDEFVKALHVKTGIEETEIKYIVGFINRLDTAAVISDGELASFHRQLESFYQKE
jgi:hypothetical protein